jgi:glucose-6-phosphate 1-dehydrogenase
MRTSFGKSSANGYERLLLDAMLGDATLFAHRDGVEATWSLLTPILEQWAGYASPRDFPNYASGDLGTGVCAMNCWPAMGVPGTSSSKQDIVGTVKLAGTS